MAAKPKESSNTNGVFMMTNKRRAATPMDEQLCCSLSPWPEMAECGHAAAGLHCPWRFWCWPRRVFMVLGLQSACTLKVLKIAETKIIVFFSMYLKNDL